MRMFAQYGRRARAGTGHRGRYEFDGRGRVS
jgi:hypothetical protein